MPIQIYLNTHLVYRTQADFDKIFGYKKCKLYTEKYGTQDFVHTTY